MLVDGFYKLGSISPCFCLKLSVQLCIKPVNHESILFSHWSLHLCSCHFSWITTAPSVLFFICPPGTSKHFLLLELDFFFLCVSKKKLIPCTWSIWSICEICLCLSAIGLLFDLFCLFLQTDCSFGKWNYMLHLMILSASLVCIFM